jgi:hypothetical protein
VAKRKLKDIDRLMRSRRVIEKAAAEGVNQALRRHVEAGVPAAEWADGRVVRVTPRRLAARLKGNGARRSGSPKERTVRGKA